ncbi:unnamed protein product [Gongylonema pulchrum]|uniref:Yippee domain-containing protein n=1 Tax=Gongylonema pulchrum TaxID=637853 RepID=A0A183F0R3_9BILA|nr:unnamed protein product [Gongylonema pulchrum]
MDRRVGRSWSKLVEKLLECPSRRPREVVKALQKGLLVLLRCGFRDSSTGPAFLFDRVVNIEYSEMQLRTMITGRHIVRDVLCKRCKVCFSMLRRDAVGRGSGIRRSVVACCYENAYASPRALTEPFFRELLECVRSVVSMALVMCGNRTFLHHLLVFPQLAFSSRAASSQS